jgi:hypothetical protein
MSRPVLFVHCGLVEGRTQTLMGKILNSFDRGNNKNDVDMIVCGVGSDDIKFKMLDDSMICRDFTRGEFFTLGNLKSFCASCAKNTPVGYIHTKGLVNGFDNPCISDWIDYMLYFVVEQMSSCIKHITDGYDAVGVDWVEIPNKHFSGNFWWSSSDYVKSLPDIDPPNFWVNGCPSHRHLAEFWIGANNPKVKCLHQSGINVYERHLHRYPESNYRILDIT